MDRDALEALWRQTLGHEGWNTLNPNQTTRPSIPPGRMAAVRRVAAATMVPDLLDEGTEGGATMVPLPEESDVGTDVSPGGLVFGDLLGEGGVARVYAAEQTALRREVAVKVVRAVSSQRLFFSEARITGALAHPHVLPVHDLVELDDGAPGLVMKRIVGESWRERLDSSRASGRPDLVAEVRRLVAVCNAIAFAHDRGIVHLDIKPENVMVGSFGEVVVLDWGCALIYDEKRWADQPDLPRTRQVAGPFGTPAFMPPEMAMGQAERIGPASDIYMLGGTLLELLTGSRPRRGESTAEIVQMAADGVVAPIPESAPPALRELAEACLAPEPGARPGTVLEIRDVLVHWLDTREARTLAEDAMRHLLDLEARDESELGDLRDLEDELVEIAGAFHHARLLWPDHPDALEGEHRARRLLAAHAIRRGEPGLAEHQAQLLPPGDTVREGLLRRAAELVGRREQHQRQARLMRWTLGASFLAIAATSSAALAMTWKARNEAVANAEIAAERLEQVLRLADHTRVQERLAEADDLWPAIPAQAAQMRRWLDDVARLHADLPRHQQALEALGEPDEDDAIEVRWQRRLLSEVVDGVAHLDQVEVPAVQARLADALSLEERSLVAPAKLWSEVARQVAEEPRYNGLVLKPQLGLVPLGRDPDTGLQRFAHLLSGNIPVPDEDGHIPARPGDGMVLILLPAGPYAIGATPDDIVHPDPRAKPTEGPVHAVYLTPWFMAQHEVTQDQWTRIMGENPAAYRVGREIGGRVVSELHPVEQVRWREAHTAMWRVGLTLPTEAQWEAAARGRTRTVFWTGDDPESLQGAANLADRYARDHDGPESWVYMDFLDDGYVTHAPVGSYRPNPFGLYDTAGNVWEWCLDAYGDYDLATTTGDGARDAPEDAPRVFRGGGFRASVVHARSADRYSLYADDYRAYDVGLRAARPLDP